jgi:hypothetical protein
MKVAVLIVLLLLIPAAVVWARDLGQLARQEKERREALTDTGRVYTNADLEVQRSPVFQTDVVKMPEKRRPARRERDPMESALRESIAALKEERRRCAEDFFDRARRAGALPGWLR